MTSTVMDFGTFRSLTADAINKFMEANTVLVTANTPLGIRKYFIEIRLPVEKGCTISTFEFRNCAENTIIYLLLQNGKILVNDGANPWFSMAITDIQASEPEEKLEIAMPKQETVPAKPVTWKSVDQILQETKTELAKTLGIKEVEFVLELTYKAAR